MGDEIHSSVNCVDGLVKLCGIDRDIKISDVTLTRLLISSTIDIVAKDQSYNDVIVKPFLEDHHMNYCAFFCDSLVAISSVLMHNFKRAIYSVRR